MYEKIHFLKYVIYRIWRHCYDSVCKQFSKKVKQNRFFLCSDPWHPAAFQFYMASGSTRGRIVQCRQRIHLGTYEAPLFPFFSVFSLGIQKIRSSSKDLLTARTLGLFCGLAFIPVSFYTYTGVIGKGFFPVDIAIFAVSVFLTFYASTRFLAHPLKLTTFTAFLLLFALLAAFLTFTFFPPHIQLFLDPVDFTYGI